MKKKNIKLLVEKEFDRESEKMADINGTKMMINSGYKKAKKNKIWRVKEKI